MSDINTVYLNKCIETLKKSYKLILTTSEDTIEYEMYRNALVKGFEMTLEQSGKLMRKKLQPYFASNKDADKLTFKNIFRYANKHSLIDEKTTERWLQYRDNRNSTAHNYGVEFAKQTLALIDDFIKDAENLKDIIDSE